MKYIMPLLLCAALYLPLNTLQAQTHKEQDGILIIEMESTLTRRGYWKFLTKPLKGHTGKGYLQFYKNKTAGGKAMSPMTFRFKINKGGVYYFALHCARDSKHGQPHDHSNDCYIRVDGSYSAPKLSGKRDKAALFSILRSDSKFFGGKVDEFSWGGTLDVNHKKYTAAYNFRAGQTYRLTISGRSQWFSINRMAFWHEDVNKKEAHDLSRPESPTR